MTMPHSSAPSSTGSQADLDEADPQAAGTDEPAASPPLGLDTAALIQTLGSGSLDPLSLLLSQLSAKSPDDPSLAMMSQLILQRRASDQPVAAPGDSEDREARQVEAAERLAELNAMVERLFRETEVLRARCGELADALGACGVCFGSDLLCPECGGRGRPGGRPPKPDAYRVYVRPAVARVKQLMQAQAARVASPGVAPPGLDPSPKPNPGVEHARYL